jgi:hypothetical protein
LVIVPLTSYLVYLDHPLFSVLAINMIFVMHVSYANTPGYPFVAHRIVQNTHLI